jgi:hypothetical protein
MAHFAWLAVSGCSVGLMVGLCPEPEPAEIAGGDS